MALLNFDASQISPNVAFEPIPAGWYNGQITSSEMKPTSDGQGAYLALEITVLSGEFAGRKIFDRINLQHKNPVTVEIAYQTLSAICHAVGVIQVQDSQQLHGRPFQVKVALRPAGLGADGKQYEASNSVKGYKAVEGASQAPGGVTPSWAVSPQPPQPAQPAVPPVQPWQAPAQPQAPASIPPWMAQPAQPAVPPVQQPAAQVPQANVPPWAK